MLQAADGSWIGNAKDIDEMLRGAWDPIFCVYASRPEPSWELFLERFGTYIGKHPMEARRLKGEDLQRTLQRMKPMQASGSDGWRVSEMKRLPLTLLNKLADVLHMIEETGIWPAALEQAAVTLIPKDEGVRALDRRPISVMSAVYRTWAASRMRDVKVWQEAWASANQHGYRAGHSTEDVYWALALRIEEALLSGEALCGLSLDYSKCFDRLPHKILFKLVEEPGLSRQIAPPLRTMYQRLRRRFRVGGHVGAEFIGTNGILQ